MKKSVKLFLVCCLLPLCYACSSVVPLQLDTLRPAKVSYRMAYPPVDVVCNSDAPDVSERSRYIDESGKHFRMDFLGDSIPYFFTLSLSTLLDESACFDSVTTVFPDSSFITGMAGLSPDEVWQWHQELPNTVILSVNEVMPVACLHVDPFDSAFGVGLEIASTATIQCCVPGAAPITESVADTLAWYAYGLTPQEARVQLPSFEDCLREALLSLAQRAAHCFVPHTLTVERYIFVTPYAAMTDAYKYWQDGKQQEASFLWEYVYEEAKNVGRRARAAANLALYHELQDDYATAITYARAAHNLFVAAGDEAEAEYAAAYAADLQLRRTDAVLLDTQWGDS